MNIQEYLARIGYKGSVSSDLDTLFHLHESHVMAVPFEDLDIHLNRPIKLDLDSLFRKVVRDKRGGFCYELNYLFYNLLCEIGFDCRMISSRIWKEQEKLGPEFDHMSIIVEHEGTWLVDVGYGDLFLRPILVKDGHVTQDPFNSFKVNKLKADSYLLSVSTSGQDSKKRYQFHMAAREVYDFQEQCLIKQTSEDSHFVENRICTIPTEFGRITLMNDKRIERRGEVREETSIVSDECFLEILERDFDIVISNAL